MSPSVRVRSWVACSAVAAAAHFAPTARADDAASERASTLARFLAATPEAAAVTTPPVLCGGGVPAASPADPCGSRCTRIRWTLGGWIPGVTGSVAAEGREVDLDSDWTDTLGILHKVEFGIDARVRIETGRLRFDVGVFGGRLADSVRVREDGAGADGEFSLWTAHAQVGYRFGGRSLGCGPCAPVVCPEVYVGARGYRVHAHLDAPSAGGDDVETTRSWVDPIVGGRLDLRFASRWFATAQGDVGGFGVGSDFAWFAMAAVGRGFSEKLEVSAGWKVLRADYDDGSFGWDLRLSGPFVAVTFSF